MDTKAQGEGRVDGGCRGEAGALGYRTRRRRLWVKGARRERGHKPRERPRTGNPAAEPWCDTERGPGACRGSAGEGQRPWVGLLSVTEQ